MAPHNTLVSLLFLLATPLQSPLWVVIVLKERNMLGFLWILFEALFLYLLVLYKLIHFQGFKDHLYADDCTKYTFSEL